MNDERTLLFRAVLPAEFNSIVTSGCFQNGTSIPSMLIAPECRVVVDLGIVTVTVPTNLLYALEPPTILEVV